MHELSLCQSLLDQAHKVAAAHRAERILRITVRLGPLSGVEPRLLTQAFPLASAGSLAHDAQLDIQAQPLVVHCETCGADTDASPARLVCGNCGDYHTRIVSGDELLLANVELET